MSSFLFFYLPEINWLAVFYYRKVLSIPVLLYTFTHQGLVFGKKYSWARAAENPTKISRTQINVGLQHTCKCLHCSRKTNIKLFGCIGNIRVYININFDETYILTFLLMY